MQKMLAGRENNDVTAKATSKGRKMKRATAADERVCIKFRILMLLVLDTFSLTFFCPQLPLPAQPAISNFATLSPRIFKFQLRLANHSSN